MVLPLSVVIPGHGVRRLGDWVDAFFAYTDILPSPPLFRRWAGITAIAGALERKVWVVTLGKPFYPNLYTILVAPPGVGKTILTSQVGALWGDLREHHVGPSSVTKASLMDSLVDARRIVINPHMEFNSLLVNSNELGVLVPGYDSEFMNSLTDMYDGHAYRERKRGGGLKIEIEHPQLNLLAATTPSYLNSVLPEGAWDQGFMSRTILIYSGEIVQRNLFSEETASESLRADLLNDLQVIGDKVGQLSFTRECKDAISAWQIAGCPPLPEHPKLQHYNTRRLGHIIKLSMVACMSDPESNMIITETHFARARDWLIEAEFYTSDIFKAMSGSGGDQRAMEDCWYYMTKEYIRTSKGIPEHNLVEFLRDRVPAHSLMRVIDIMERGQLIRGEYDYKTQGKSYKPRPREGWA